MKKADDLKNINTPIKYQTYQFGGFNFSIGSDGFDTVDDFLVEDLITRNSFGVVYGPSSSLKTFFTLDLAASIACGLNWGDRSVISGGVVYVAAEGQRGIAKRIRAFELVNNKLTRHLFVLGQSIIMSDKGDSKKLVEAVREIEDEFNIKVELVVIDTLARCFDGDENQVHDMTPFIRACEYVQTSTDTTVLCVHHSGHNDKHGARGSTALRGACDFEFKVKRNGKVKAKTTTLSNTKQKDCDEAPDIKIEFDLVDLGIRCKKNKPIMSLARVKPLITLEENEESNSPILLILMEKLSGRATVDELKKALFKTNTPLTASQRKQFSRDIKKLKEEGRIRIEQANESRISATDMIYVCH